MVGRVGGFFQMGGMSKVLAGGGDFPHPPSRENPVVGGSLGVIKLSIKKTPLMRLFLTLNYYPKVASF